MIASPPSSFGKPILLVPYHVEKLIVVVEKMEISDVLCASKIELPLQGC
jgi:hypothetical protein